MAVARLREWIKGGLAGLAALAALFQPVAAVARDPVPAVSAGSRTPAAQPRPAIWLIEDSDTKIYLFGTVHVFPSALRWRSAALDRVIAEADELVMETPDASMAEAFDPERLLAPMEMGKSVSILERVSPEARPRLRAALEATGMPIEYYDRLHIWGVAFLLTGFQISQQYAGDGKDGARPVALTGAEEQLGALFRRTKRPISGVETIEEQIAVFATMPLSAQRRFLESTVTEGDPASPSPDMAETAWVQGDVDSLAAEMQALPSELYDALLTRRNRNWTDWLVERMEKPGTVLFAVGAGHLAGPDSVQRMLAERGLTARRVN